MTELTKTIIAVVIALALVGLVYATRPAPVTSESFNDQGELFFPEFTDPGSAASLEVLGWDEQSASLIPFKVELTGGRWTIPSHHGYPADAATTMGAAASALIGLAKEVVVTDSAAEHQAMGVLDPEAAAAPLSGRGTRVTFRDAQGAELASLIVGREWDESASTGSRKFFVRLPGSNRVYATEFEETFSTDFSSWIETDLLDLGSAQIDRIVVDAYSVDETAGQKISSERLTITRSGDASATNMWTVLAEPAGETFDGEQIDGQRINSVIQTLRQLELKGVRPKPARLVSFFRGESAQVTQSDFIDLVSKGFFLTQNGAFAANEGEIRFHVGDGVLYTLYFGEILVGSGREISSGLTEDAGDDAPGTATASAASEELETRYIFVRVALDESLVPEPEAPLAEDGSEGPPAQDSEAYQQALADREQTLATSRGRVAELAARFADWYYVIDASAFEGLRPSADEVVKAEEPQPAAPGSEQPEPSPAGEPG